MMMHIRGTLLGATAIRGRQIIRRAVDLPTITAPAASEWTAEEALPDQPGHTRVTIHPEYFTARGWADWAAMDAAGYGFQVIKSTGTPSPTGNINMTSDTWISGFANQPSDTVNVIVFLYDKTDMSEPLDQTAQKSFDIQSTPPVDDFDLGDPDTVDPGEEIQLNTVTVSGIDAGVIVPAEFSGGDMRVLDDQGAEVSAKGASSLVSVQVGYQIETWATGVPFYGTTTQATLRIGDDETGTVVSDTTQITTRSLTVTSSGGFTTLDGSGGAIEYDIDDDGTADGTITEAEQAALVGQPPYFEIAPSYTENGDNLEISIGYPVYDGDTPRYRVEVLDAAETVLSEWDTDVDWTPDPAETLTYNKSADTGTLTINWIASDENGSTQETDTFEAADPGSWSISGSSIVASPTITPPTVSGSSITG